MERSKCKRFTLCGLLIASAFFTSSCKKATSPSSNADTSALEIERSHVDLGAINEGESKTGELIVFNRSRYPVSIDQVAASCGCTAATVADEVIPPGGNSTLRVELSPQGRRGAFGSSVSVEWSEKTSASPRTGKTKVDFQAVGLFVANATPGYVDFGTVKVNAEPLERVLAVSRGTQPIPFADVIVESGNPSILATIDKRDNDHWQISVALQPGLLPGGPLNSHVSTIFTNSAGDELARREISVRGEIKGLVSVKPKTLFFGVVLAGTTKTGSLVFRAPDGRSAGILSVRAEPAPDCLALDFGSSPSNSSESTINYSLNTAGKSGDLSGRLFVQFSDQKLGEISVPYILHVKESK